MINRKGQKPRIETPVLKTITGEIRAVLKNVWPELISSFPRGLRCPPERRRLGVRPKRIGSGDYGKLPSQVCV